MKPFCLSGRHLLCDSDEFLISQDEDSKAGAGRDTVREREKDAKRFHIGIVLSHITFYGSYVCPVIIIKDFENSSNWSLQ